MEHVTDETFTEATNYIFRFQGGTEATRVACNINTVASVQCVRRMPRLHAAMAGEHDEGLVAQKFGVETFTVLCCFCRGLLQVQYSIKQHPREEYERDRQYSI